VEALAPLYPRFDDFRRLRAELDPRGRFLNEHLRGLFGV
jgi:FAD/FMN-containing dehydrogenase